MRNYLNGGNGGAASGNSNTSTPPPSYRLAMGSSGGGSNPSGLLPSSSTSLPRSPDLDASYQGLSGSVGGGMSSGHSIMGKLFLLNNRNLKGEDNRRSISLHLTQFIFINKILPSIYQLIKIY